jgi:ankyrin repeat protein
MMSSSSTSSKLINWVFIGNLSNPPNIWKSLQTGEIPDVINNFFEFPEDTLFPNGQFLRRGRETNLLQAAAAAGRVDFLNYFRNIPQIDITKKTTSDISVFHLALDGDTVRCLRTVNKNNPNETEQLLETLMQSTSDTGSTPVHYAVGRPSAMKALLELGCNPVVRNNGKSIPLHYAGSREVAELLIKYSSSTFVNTKNSLGDTPLHLAISHGLTEVVMVLLRHGADIELPLNSLSRRNVTMTVNKLLGKLEQQILSQQYLSNVRDRSSGSSGSGGSGGSSGSGGSGGSGEKEECIILSKTNIRELRGLKEIKMLFGDWECLHPLQLKRCCWFGFRTLCQKPKAIFLKRVPNHLVDEIITHFLGPFDGTGEPVYLKNIKTFVQDEEKLITNHENRRSCSIQ